MGLQALKEEKVVEDTVLRRYAELLYVMLFNDSWGVQHVMVVSLEVTVSKIT